MRPAVVVFYLQGFCEWKSALIENPRIRLQPFI